MTFLSGWQCADTDPDPHELREVNLVGYDFDVDRLPNGNYRITQTVSAELAPWYAYQNIRLLGVSPVGKARVIESREVSGDEFIPVCSSSGNEFIQVKDAARFKAVKKASFCSEKALVATVDAAMLVSGLIECRAVYSAARIAATAANAELRLTTGQALLQGGSAVLRTTVAGLGVLNGAGGRAFSPGGLPVGDWINNGRSLYFLGDSALAVGRGGLNIYQWLKGSRSGVPGALSAAERVDALIHGLPARGGRAAIDGLPLAGPLHTATKHTFRAAEFLYAKQIGTDLLLQRQKLAEVGKRDAADDFKEFATGDKGIQDRIPKPNE